MPKLKDPDMERNRQRIQAAALRKFIQQGYHGTTMRDVAREAEVSMGNIYNYYKTKEELYVTICRDYQRRIAEMQRSTVWPLVGRTDREGLILLAKAVKKVIYGNPDYWRLMYIDVVEFGNRHFAFSFRQLAKVLEKASGVSFAERCDGDVREGVEPRLAAAAIYLQFASYFLVEKLFGGKQHLGVPDDAAIDQMVRIFTQGLWPDRSGKRRT